MIAQMPYLIKDFNSKAYLDLDLVETLLEKLDLEYGSRLPLRYHKLYNGLDLEHRGAMRASYWTHPGFRLVVSINLGFLFVAMNQFSKYQLIITEENTLIVFYAVNNWKCFCNGRI